MLPRVCVLCLCVFWGLGAAQRVEDLREGDICKQLQLGSWTCKQLRDCPNALQDVRNGKSPQQCYSPAFQHVVCCEPSQSLLIPETGIKSKQMCEKYAESVFLNVPSFGRSKPQRINLCAVAVPLIINGQNAKPKEFPHMALIGYGDNKSWKCGGSLISERYILSAAHCSINKDGEVARWARLGDYNINSKKDDKLGNAQTTDYQIVDRINHPNYRNSSLYHDIALYQLEKNVQFTEFIRPICLQTEHQFAKIRAIATGWGHTEWQSDFSSILQKVNLTIKTGRRCSRHYRALIGGVLLSNGILDASQLCAGYPKRGRDTAQGDSGGPLQIRLDHPYCMYSQVGITSFGPTYSEDKPGIFTRVSHYVPWIESVVWP